MAKKVLPLVVLLASAALIVSTAPAAPLAQKDVRVEGMSVTVVPDGQTVQIDPLPLRSHQSEGVLKAGQPGWRGPVYLPQVAWTFRALTRGSLVVSLADKPDVRLAEGKDYLLDADWGTLGAVESSQYPAGTKLQFAFTWTGSRIDLVERTPDGTVVVRKGQEDPKGQPHLPEFTPGYTPLLSVYLAPNTTALTMANINLIDLEAAKSAPVSGAEHLKAVRQKLAAGRPVTIAFLGDSITAQQPKDFRDGRGSFVDRFAAHLQAKYPDSKVVVTARNEPVSPADGQVVVVKAGVGGDDTPRALKRMDADVLAHKPDAVVIMLGVNDENRRGQGNSVPVADYRKNLETIVQKTQGAGAAAVVMTTSMKNLDWAGTVGNLNEYAAAAREVAAARKACLVDNFKSWEDLPRRGYNYMIFLGTCINHPIDLGHELFFQNLKAAFEAD